ncbi:MAG: Uma2 family endonuclease, partial [Planctomycetota bacterium]
EVMSKNDTAAELEQKADEYLAHGVEMVWVLNPRRRTLTVFQRGIPAFALGLADTLTGGDVLPGFSVKVADLFAD